MKNTLILLSVLIIAGCSSPKYTYKFDHYDYNSPKSSAHRLEKERTSPELDPATLSASTEPVHVDTKKSATVESQKAVVTEKYSSMTKADKKEFRKEVKAHIKSYAKAMKKGDVVKANQEINQMDNDLKLAIIFGAVGLTLSLFGGINEAFWILGVIAIVVGVVFLVKWLVRQ